jgi:hypothetical protein
MSTTTVHRAAHPAFDADCPYTIAIVQLAEGARLMANVVGASGRALSIGDAVRVCFEERRDAHIPQVEPA